MRRYLFFALLSLCLSLSAPAAHALVTFDELGRLMDAEAAYAQQNPHIKGKGLCRNWTAMTTLAARGFTTP